LSTRNRAPAPKAEPKVEREDGPKLLVLDWGIGGFGVVRELRRKSPKASLVYFSDSGFLPYGKVPSATLARRLEHVVRWFFERGVRRVVVACNAASTVVPLLTLPKGLVVHDVITPGVALVRAAKVDHVGLVGGARTVRSGAHRRKLSEWGIEVTARVAQPLSALVEAGELDTPRVAAEMARIVKPLAKLPALLLACTHYPALLPLFRAALPKTRLLDPAERLVRDLLRSTKPEQDERLVVLTTGRPEATRASARLAFGVDLPRVERVGLDLADG
jgi:glutamate racemase